MSTIKVKKITMLRQHDEDVELKLIGGPDDGLGRSDEYQAELSEVADALRAQDPGLGVGSGIQKAAGMSSWLTGDFIIHAISVGTAATVAVKTVVPVLVEYVKAKAGRTIKIKKGDIEVEAHSVEEVRKVLDELDRRQP